MSYSEAQIPQFDVVFGRNLMAEAVNFAHPPFLVVTMEDLWPVLRERFPPGCEAYFVRSLEREDLEAALPGVRRFESIIGAGGGQAIDCAKYFSWRTRLPLFQYPTSLSVDAVFGHRAGVRDGGRVRYVGFAVPESVYVDYGVIESAPAMINRAGIGDVLCFITGVMDWRYADDKGRCEARWPYDESLAQISLAKAEAVLAALDDVRDLTPKGVDLLVSGLRWGGASYHGAGWNPRHIEGVEHYVFYALEAATGQKFLHGQAVGLGLVAGCMMHGARDEEMLTALHRVGLDLRPQAMGDDLGRCREGVARARGVRAGGIAALRDCPRLSGRCRLLRAPALSHPRAIRRLAGGSGRAPCKLVNGICARLLQRVEGLKRP